MSQESPEQQAARLVQEVNHPDWRVAFRAQEQLAGMGAIAAAELVRALRTQPASAERQHFMVALARIGPPAIPAIVALLDDEKPQRVQAAMELLAEIDPLAAGEYLGPRLFHVDADLRASALELLLSNGEAPDADWFRRLIEDSEEPNAWQALLDTLARRVSNLKASRLLTELASREEATLILLEALKSEDEDTGFGAQRGLLRLGALPFPELCELLSDYLPAVRARAASLLYRAGEQAVPHVIKIIEDSQAEELLCAECRAPVPADHPCCEVCGCAVPQTTPEWEQTMVSLACQVLTAIGPPAVPAAADLARRRKGLPQRIAIRLLAHLKTGEAIPVFVETLPSANGWHAAHGLLELAKAAPTPRLRSAIPALKRQMQKRISFTTRPDPIAVASHAALAAIIQLYGDSGDLPVPAEPGSVPREGLPRPATPQDPVGEFPRPSSPD